MANYATLKATISAAIKQNGNNEITGNLLQQQLLAMVNSLGVGYQYAGIATPETNPGTPDQNVFYLASTAGTYTNFGGWVLADGEIAILKWNGAWSKDSTGAASLEKLNQLGQEVGMLPCITDDDSDNDFNIGDEDGNVILGLKDGHIKTKNFDSESLDSKDSPKIMEDDSDAEFNIGDKLGNVVLQVKGGNIKTKNFDSEFAGVGFLLSNNNTPRLAHDYSQSIDIDTDANTVITNSRVTLDDGTEAVYPNPGGYPAFWIRDYAMALDSGYPFTSQEVLACYNLIKNNVPTSGAKAYWVPDHILRDGSPVWKAGTYDPDPSTSGYGSRASLDGIGFLVKIADKYVQLTNDTQFMSSELPFLLAATKSIMRNNLAYVPLTEEAVVFGFEDLILMSGYVAYASIQAYESMIILKNWAEKTGVAWHEDINAIKTAFNEKFVRDNGYKMFRLNGVHYADTAYVAPSTHKDKDRFDVWQTAYAIRSGILNDNNIIRCASALLFYKDSYIRNGMAKHVPDEFYYSPTSMWENANGIGRYQLGGYWSTPMMDIISAIKIISRTVAEDILTDAVNYGHNLNWPECVNEDYSTQNTQYVSSVTYVYRATQL